METEIADFYTEPYDCNQHETRPDNVVYTSGFRELQDLNKVAASILRKPLEDSRIQNSITKSLMGEIAKRTKEDYPDQVKFAIVGDMKAVINALLSIGTIARKGDGGDSCTWVVQRYQKRFPDQSSTYAAKVRFFDREGIRNTIGDLLARYYRAANKDVKDEEDCEDDGDDRDYTRVESYGDMRDSMTAFKALFCKELEFETEDRAHAFLKQAKSESDPRILNKLVDWADAVIERHLNGKTAVLIENSTTDGLLWELQPYTYQIGGLEDEGIVAPWPLVSAIDFGLDHPLLKEGIVFIDSPGLSDANSSRSKNAIRSHRECTHKMVVAEIGRAEADLAVRKNLQAGSRTRGSGHMLLVLTHGDHIGPETQVSGTPIEKKRIARLDADLKKLRAQKQQKLLECSRARPEDRDDLAEELRSFGPDIRRLTMERDNCRLEMRNRKVVIKMQTIYNGLTSDPKPLNAFAVGNQVYQQHVAGFSDDDKPLMSVEKSGIPALRKALYMMPIQGRLNDTMHLAEIQLPNLVNTIELYCAQLHPARKNEIEAIVLAPKKLLRAVVHESYEALKIQVLDTVLTPIKEYESEWIKKAREICSAWPVALGGQIALLKSEGYRKAHKGKNNSKGVDWNYELLEIGSDTIEDAFNNFHGKLISSSWARDLTNNLVKMCDDARKEIKRDGQFHTLALEPFFNTFNGESRNFDRIVRLCIKTLSRHIGDIHGRATTRESDDYITLAMKPVYLEVTKIKGGRGAPKRRAVHVEGAVSKRNGVWIDVHDSIDVGFDELFERAENHMVTRFGEVFDSLHNNFRMLCENSEAKNEKEKVLEGELRDNLREKSLQVKGMLAEGGEIAKLIAACKAYQAPPAGASQSLFVPQ